MYITVQFKINIVFFIVPNLVIFLHSFSTIVTERLHQQHHFQAFISYARHLIHGMADCHLHSQAIITWVLLFGQSWKSAKPGQIDSAFLFTPPVRWHWQGKLMRAFKVACHSNVWLQFLIRAARKLSRAFTLYVELGRAKNINSEEMNVTTVLGWPLTWTLILLVKPSISDESHSKKKAQTPFSPEENVLRWLFRLIFTCQKEFWKTGIILEYVGLLSKVWHPWAEEASTSFLPRICLRDETCRPLKFYGSAVNTHHSGSIINSCVQTGHAECW